MARIPVYFMPGLAASSAIFEHIRLPEDVFETILLEWEIPLQGETLKAYAKRLCKKIVHNDPVLIGVSFGGILVQEMANFVKARRVIIISSAKCNAEYPLRFRIAKSTGAYKLIPVSLADKVDLLAKFYFGPRISGRLKLYKKYLAMRDVTYLKWAIEQVVLWDRDKPDENVIHIHGEDDMIFPARNIKGFIPVKGGTHIMVINKYRWLNKHLPHIILYGTAN